MSEKGSEKNHDDEENQFYSGVVDESLSDVDPIQLVSNMQGIKDHFSDSMLSSMSPNEQKKKDSMRENNSKLILD